MKWFRMYASMVDSVKVGSLTDAAFRTYVNLQCLAGERQDSGRTGVSAKSINWRLRRDALCDVTELSQCELVTISSDGEYIVSDWEIRQKEGDTSAARMRKMRLRQAEEAAKALIAKDVTQQPVTGNVTLLRSDALEEKRGDKNKTLVARAKEILFHLNTKSGRNFRPVDSTLKFIVGRLNDGVTVDQCKLVIDAKIAEWLNDPKMAQYLSPDTIFNPTKFEKYLGQLSVGEAARAWD